MAGPALGAARAATAVTGRRSSLRLAEPSRGLLGLRAPGLGWGVRGVMAVAMGELEGVVARRGEVVE